MIAAFVVLSGSFAAWKSTPLSEFSVRARDGAAWLPSFAIGGVSLLDGASGSTVTSLAVVGNDELFDVIDWHDHAIIVNGAAGTLARLDSASWTIPGIVQVASPGEPMTVAVGDSTGWLLQPNTVTPLDPMTLSIRQPLPISTDVLDAVVSDDGSLLFSSTEGGPVQRLRPAEDQPSDVDGLGGRVSFQRLDPNTIAAVDLDSTSVWIEGRDVVCEQLPFLPDASLTIGGGEAELFVVSDGGVGFVWDPLDAGCPDRSTDFVSLGPGDYQDPVVVGTWGAVADARTGEVIVVTLESPPSVERVRMTDVDPGEMVDLVGESGSIWYNAPATANAGLVQPDGTLLAVTKYGDEGFTAAEITDPDDVSVAGMEQEPDDIAASPTTTTPPSTTTPPPGDSPDNDQVTTTTNTAGSQSTSTSTTTAPIISTPPTGPDDATATSESLPSETTTTTENSSTTVEESHTSPDGSTTSTSEPVEQRPDNQPELSLEIAQTAVQVVVDARVGFEARFEGPLQTFEWSFSPDGGQVVEQSLGATVRTFGSVGPVRLTLEGCTVDDRCLSASASINVVEDPDQVRLAASFDLPATGTAGVPVPLRNTSQGNPESYEWTFDDGSPTDSSKQNPTVTWTDPGTKTVTLVVERDGENDQLTKTIVIAEEAAPPPFGVVCTRTEAPVKEFTRCSLDGDTNEFEAIEWTSPGAESDTALHPGSHSVRRSTAGTITVTLSAIERASGRRVSGQTTVSVVAAPACTETNPSIEGPLTLDVGQTSIYTVNHACADVTYRWIVGGSPTLSGSNTERQIDLRWEAVGSHSVEVAVTSSGVTTTKAIQVQITAEPSLRLEVVADINGGCNGVGTARGNEVRVIGSTGPITDSSWTFSGPSPSSYFYGSNFEADVWTFVLCQPGTTTVTLSARGESGAIETASVSFSVTTTIPIDIRSTSPLAGPLTAEVGEVINFTADVTGSEQARNGYTPFDVFWDFGDGTSDSSSDVRATNRDVSSHSWSAPGTYVVTVTVANSINSDSRSWTVTVNAPPPPDQLVVSIVGPAEVNSGETHTYTAQVTSGQLEPGFFWTIEGFPWTDSGSGSVTYTFHDLAPGTEDPVNIYLHATGGQDIVARLIVTSVGPPATTTTTSTTTASTTTTVPPTSSTTVPSSTTTTTTEP